MEQSVVVKKLSESLKDIFAFSVSRLFNKEDAEDLTNDIIVEVLSSADRLKNDDAFYGFMWKIADNTFKNYIRGGKKTEIEFSEDFLGAYWDTPEEKLVFDEEVTLLRRELSLLSKQYREVTIKFYIENQSCAEISKQLGISEEMVKYYLFKTRKILKEGVTMDRKYGEKSYNPAQFAIDFWGNGNNSFVWNTFERKLPGNIALALYEKPLSLEELSLELGVSAPYLEDELEILLKHNFIKQTGNKYQTDFLIFKTQYEKEFIEKVPSAKICLKTVDKFARVVEEKLPKFKKMNLGIELDQNRLKWFIVNIALISALGEFEDSTRKRFGDYPRISSTTRGFIYGHDNNYEYGYFAGIYGHCCNQDDSAWFTAVNYNVIKSCRLWQGGTYARTLAVCNAILNKSLENQDEETVAQLVREGILAVESGKVCPKFPVLTTKDLHFMRKDLQEIIDLTCECMEKICGLATEIFKKYTPNSLRDKCERLCFVRHQADAMAIIVEKLIENKFLLVPQEKTNLCIFGVKRISGE